MSDGSQLTLVADDQAVSAAQARLRRTLVLLGLGALVVAGVILLFTTRLALAPLDAMTALARSITSGDRGRRLAPRRTDTELGRTAAAFDDMLDELEGAEAAARAAADRTRRFVAAAAHELRPPLAGGPAGPASGCTSSCCRRAAAPPGWWTTCSPWPASTPASTCARVRSTCSRWLDRRRTACGCARRSGRSTSTACR